MQAKVKATNPTYLRMYFLAVSRAKPNGHAEFGTRELGKLLGKDARAVDGALTLCKRYGLLADISTTACLVLENSLTTRWDQGNELARYVECPTHAGRPEPTNKPALCPPGHGRHEAHGLCDSCYRREKRAAAKEGRPHCWEVEPVPFIPSWDEDDPERYLTETDFTDEVR